MSTTPRDFFEGFVPGTLDAIARCLPDDVVVAFHIEGVDGGHWELQSGQNGSTIGPARPGQKDCEVWCESQTFMRLVRGTLRSNRAFLSGQLRIVGDVGLALALEGALAEAA
ncbi:MAG: SCP2 sterol-binding domain-containing protein [Myxococcota bacterium]|nr:SCP2 sterol-binding domain-containing protein [Myxococcota bacterium]MEC9391512.1 SCP2 sterol-binding domain-containing protein [Myxococcota bacterium]